MTLKWANGSLSASQLTSQANDQPNKPINQVLAMVSDDAKSRYWEDALRLAGDQLAVIMQGVADGITAQDPTGRLIYANDAAVRLLGYGSAQSLLATPLPDVMDKFELLDEWGRPFPLERLPGRLALAGELSPSAIIRFRIKATGEECWSDVKAKPIFNDEGQVELVVNIFQNITVLKQSERAQRLLAEASKVLATSLDFEATLHTVARLAILLLADYCTVYVADEDDRVRPHIEAHVDADQEILLRKLNRKYQADPDEAGSLIGEVLRTGEARLIPEISAADEAIFPPDHHGQLEPRSALLLPLIARGETLGVLVLVMSGSGRRYGLADLTVAQELAYRVALAIDNARLYQQAQRLNASLEQRVIKRTAQLQVANTKLQNEITERNEAEKALRSSELRFRTVFEGAGIGIALLDLEGRIVTSNPAFQTMLGYSQDELYQMPLTAFTHPDDPKVNLELLQILVTEKLDTFRFEKRYLRKDGGVVWGHLTVSLIRNNEDEAQFMINMVKDITARKQMETELAEVQHRLMASREAERLHLAQELHDGPMQDLYGISYQLNEVWDALPGEVGRGKLVTTQVAVQRTIQTLRTLCGELRPPALAPFGLEKAIRSHAEQFQQAQPELSLKLKLRPDRQTLPEQVRLALFRVYQQALTNIVRHAQAAHIRVELALRPDQVILAVEDDGCGFEVLKRRIELVRQGHLGLVGAAERVEAIGGELTIKSAPGQGTLVRAVIPRTCQPG
jgi:PAS domain S-box-containing protein